MIHPYFMMVTEKLKRVQPELLAITLTIFKQLFPENPAINLYYLLLRRNNFFYTCSTLQKKK